MGFKPFVFSILLFLTIKVNCDLPRVQYIVKNGDSVLHQINYTSDVLERCVVYTNNYDSHNLLLNKTIDNIEGVNLSEDPKVCQVKIIKVSQKTIGSWSLQSTFKNSTNETQKYNQDFKIAIRDDDQSREQVRLVTTRNGQIKYSFEGNIFNTISTCNLKTSNGTVYSIYPKSNVTDPRLAVDGYYCKFELKKVEVEDIGIWELEVDQQEFMGNYFRVFQPLNVVIEEKVTPYPAKSIEVYEGQNIHISLSEPVPNFIKCIINYPDNFTFISNDESCVSTIKAELGMSGMWKINGTGEILLYSEVNVTVKAKPVDVIQIRIYKDASAELIFGPNNSLYCMAKNEYEDIFVENEGQCILKIEKVTSVYAGDWNVEIGLPESMETVTYKYNIVVEDIGELHEKKIVPQYELSENHLTVSCKFLIKKMKSCHMTRSDGEVFMVNEGIGYENYKYILQQNRNDSDIVECGLEIFNPKSIDLDVWKCVVVSEDDGTQLGSYVTSKNITISDNNDEQKSLVKVAVGKSFDLICDHPSAINYCWFYSPNKTIYSLFSNTNNSDYEYIGKGLPFGQCRMRVKSAGKSDDGIWRCNIGLNNLVDTSATITVDIHGSTIKASKHMYSWYDNLDVSCSTINKNRVEYCRYVRPDGLGINPTASTKGYTNEGTDLESGKCVLKFTEFASENVGIWKCIAKAHIENEEYVETFEVYTYWSNVTTYNVFVWSMFTIFIMSLVTLLSVLVCKMQIIWSLKERRTRRSDADQSMPPPYNADLFTQNETKPNLA